MHHTVLTFFQCGHCEVSPLSPPNGPPDFEVQKYNVDPARSSASNPFVLEGLDLRCCESVFVYGPCWHQLCRITDPSRIAEQDAANLICEKDRDDMWELEDRCQAMTAEAIRTAQIGGVPNVKASLDWVTAAVPWLGDVFNGLDRMKDMVAHGEARFVWEGTKLMVGKCLDVAEDYIEDQVANMERFREVSDDLVTMDVDENMQSEDTEMSMSDSSSPCRCPPETPMEDNKAPQMFFFREINGAYVPIGEPMEHPTESARDSDVEEKPATDSPPSTVFPPPLPIGVNFTTPKWGPGNRKVSELSPGSPRSHAPYQAPSLELPLYSPITRTLQEVEDQLNLERRVREWQMQVEAARKRKLSQLSLDSPSVEHELNLEGRLPAAMHKRQKIHPFPAPFLEAPVNSPITRTLHEMKDQLDVERCQRNASAAVLGPRIQVSQAKKNADVFLQNRGTEMRADTENVNRSLFERNAVDLGVGWGLAAECARDLMMTCGAEMRWAKR